ncbi:Membrane proteinase PrsW, cleaves anti-sigma factor RsiW, M82 family [Actinomadura madurae]|uniref:Membrane proteinase PrsW, cleaves anti-sigma factor RsiW, M82 family n=1 Tax=Actinomadura madurae TaxID=1993 RepID=A0A1I4XYE9_9ACTN|nr:PrsW family glutamic-type intramembrane protease [Actinomadura madurae]SFN30807.1 Membrane proteinase PrsW, cleaves anti-sigma factor RsiW, M82 family [Actinomadura madurae]
MKRLAAPTAPDHPLYSPPAYGYPAYGYPAESRPVYGPPEPRGHAPLAAAPAARGPRLLRRFRWTGVLLTGVALYVAVLAALVATQDPVYVPSLLLIGAALVPVTFTTFVGDIGMRTTLPFSRVAAAAVLGGVVGTVLAGPLEFETARAFGSLPTAFIGLIEESAKLAVPALIIARRPGRTIDGLVLGVAVGSGFAALETMGYAFVTLLGTHGDLLSVTHILLTRALAEPGGHAAWTGLATAALVAVRNSRHRGVALLRFGLVFAGVVTMHALWDASAGGNAYLVIGGVSLAALLLVTWILNHNERTHAGR